MSKINYTDEQKKAVINLDDNIILGAGAGSGKTRVLVGRYLNLIAEKRAEIKNILAITFTRKAAAEMLERIREEFLQKSRQGTAGERKFWHERLNDLNQAQISTFHGFASRILRENPVAAAIDPEFKVMDEEEADRILTAVIANVIESGLAESDEDLLMLAREYGLYKLPELLKNLYLAMEKATITPDRAAELTAEQLVGLRREREEYKQQLVELGEELLSIFTAEGASGKTGEKLQHFQAEWPAIKLALQNILTIEESQYLVEIEKIPVILKNRLAGNLNEPAKELKDGVKDDYWISLLLLDKVEKVTSAMSSVVRKVDHQYREQKQEKGVLDFSDLQSILVRLLKEDESFLEKLQEKYRYIMVDEFQDNSPLQEEIIGLLAAGEGVNLFLVGDPKQSIYRFRGADVEVFNSQQRKIVEQGGQNLMLSKNFRSRPGIINLVNYLFSHLLDEEGNVEYQELAAHRDNSRGKPELILVNEKELEDDVESRQEEAVALAHRVMELIAEGEVKIEEDGACRGVQFGDIAFLFQSLAHVEIYEQALQTYNIPYQVVNGRGFYEQQEVKDILNLFRVIDNQQKNISLAGLLRSPFCGITDEELFYLTGEGSLWEAIQQEDDRKGISPASWSRIVRLKKMIVKARSWKDSLAPDRLLKRALEETSYLEVISAAPFYQQQSANINKLIEITRQYSENNLPSIRDLIAYLEEKRETYNREGLGRVEQSGKGMVQLMSIHQSKGLEFPVVILPDSQRQLFNHSYVDPILLDEEQGFALKVRYRYQKREEQKSPLYLRLYEQEKLENIEESKRLFYVALTRARDHLIISGTVKGRKKKRLETLSSANSWLDWLTVIFGLDFTSDIKDELDFSYDDFQGGVRLQLIDGQTEERIDVKPAVEKSSELLELPSIQDWYDLEEWRRIAPWSGPLDILPSEENPVLSVTGLLNYQQCPRQYYYKYRLRAPEYQPAGSRISRDRLSEQVGDKQSGGLSPARKGTLIHRVSELAEFSNRLDDIIDRAGRELELDEGILQLHREEVKKLVSSYQQREEKRREKAPELEWESREQPFILKFPGFYLRGTIDHMLAYSNGSGQIIDLKSNMIEQEEVDQTADKYRIQLEAYALAAYQIWGLVPVQARIDFLLPEEDRVVTFNQNRLQEIASRLEKMGSEIICRGTEDDFTTLQADTCRFCQYQYLCD